VMVGQTGTISDPLGKYYWCQMQLVNVKTGKDL